MIQIPDFSLFCPFGSIGMLLKDNNAINGRNLLKYITTIILNKYNQWLRRQVTKYLQTSGYVLAFSFQEYGKLSLQYDI